MAVAVRALGYVLAGASAEHGQALTLRGRGLRRDRGSRRGCGLAFAVASAFALALWGCWAFGLRPSLGRAFGGLGHDRCWGAPSPPWCPFWGRQRLFSILSQAVLFPNLPLQVDARAEREVGSQDKPTNNSASRLPGRRWEGAVRSAWGLRLIVGGG